MIFRRSLLTILRLAHCRNVHHKFAIDAIPLVRTAAGRRLASVLLRHYDRYLTGSTDPDTRFCDFQNHVIHVTDGYWGGAPRVAHKWYDRLQRYLRTGRYSDAAHAAGVLSHYFTDAFQPLHTQHDEREKALHFPIEWNIAKSYEAIYRLWKEADMQVVVQLSNGPGWLGEAMLHGSRFANTKFQLLMDHFDPLRAMSDPPTGLDFQSQESLAELFALSITGWARVLERVAEDAEAARGKPLPNRFLWLPTFGAALQTPARLWLRWNEDRQQRVAVAQLLEELYRTGTVKQHLPVEVDIIHRVIRVREDEKRWKQERQRRLASESTMIDVINTNQASKREEEAPVIIPMVRPATRRRHAA